MVDNPEYEKLTLVTLGGGGSNSRFSGDVNCERPRTKKPIRSQKQILGHKTILWPKQPTSTPKSIHNSKFDSVPNQSPKNRFKSQKPILIPKIDSESKTQKLKICAQNRILSQIPMLDPKINFEPKFDSELKILILSQKIDSLDSEPKNRFRT